ncbi:Amino acid/polyamine transporter I [Penicillium sp. CMV-2018d]|nr:Amino acid/polyamine transporter I [Penicillium sp. CMV-2018d]
MASELSDELPKTFGLWSGLSIGWNTINVFGGMSFILFVGLSAGDFDVSSRWQNFLIYVAFATWAWLINVFGVKIIPGLELLGSLSTALGFVAFTVALLAVSPKASAESVFKTINNDTGYSSNSFAVFLGLYNSMTTLMALDGPTHLAEELPSPKRIMPRILIITIVSQAVLGVAWIIVLGFSIGDLQSIIHTSTGVPVIELVRQATRNDAAAIIFCLILIINNGTSAVASATTFQLPLWSIHLPYLLTVLIGLVAAFNAIVGSQAVFMISSCGSPALIMLLTGRRLLPHSPRWDLGRFAYPICVVAVGYSLLVLSVAFIPQSSPVTSLNMNYTVLIVGVFLIIMALTWIFVGRKVFQPPSKDPEVYILDIQELPGSNCAVHIIVDGSRNKDQKML